MANALDRVKAAEAKYTAMGETAEKLESTLKNFKGEADLCYATMRELHREIKKGPEGPALGFLVARVGGRDGGRGRRHLWKFFYGRLPCESSMLWGLGGEADANLSAACWSCLGGVGE